MNERRNEKVKRFFLWFVAPLDDRIRGLSLTRLLAVACFFFVWHEIEVGHEIALKNNVPVRLSWIDYATFLLGVAAAFGKSVVLALINRNQVNVDGKEIRETVDITVREIQERREAAERDGWPGREVS